MLSSPRTHFLRCFSLAADHATGRLEQLSTQVANDIYWCKNNLITFSMTSFHPGVAWVRNTLKLYAEALPPTPSSFPCLSLPPASRLPQPPASAAGQTRLVTPQVVTLYQTCYTCCRPSSTFTLYCKSKMILIYI